MRNTQAYDTALPPAYLVDMVEFEVFEKEKEQGRDTLYNDLLVSVHVNAQLHALENSYATRERGSISIKVVRREA